MCLERELRWLLPQSCYQRQDELIVRHFTAPARVVPVTAESKQH